MSKATNRPLEERRRWFEKYAQRWESENEAPPPHGMRYPCPCCGYRTLAGRSQWEICSLCDWEDDGQDDPYADEVWGGPNYTYSLSEARHTFEQYLIKFTPGKRATRIGGNSNTPVEEEAKRQMVEAFDRMVGENDPATLAALWE